MWPANAILLLTGMIPLSFGWKTNKDTSLRQTIIWAWIAWAAWIGDWLARLQPAQHTLNLTCYLALCLTACTGIAVLGARRPGISAWNFVLVGLLAVLLLPVAEGWGDVQSSPLRTLFLGATLAVPLLNYLPTRFAPAAFCLALGCSLALANLEKMNVGGITERLAPLAPVLIGASPWLAWLASVERRPAALSEFDHLWLDFRDRFGLLWGQRMREQFNRSAANAGWPVFLSWQGLKWRSGASRLEEGTQKEMFVTLQLLLKRFGAASEDGADERKEGE